MEEQIIMSPKMQCLWRPAQSGKTKKMTEIICEHESGAEHLNILICSNARLLVSQTTARMKRDLFRAEDDSDSDESVSSNSSSVSEDPAYSDDRIDGNVFSWMSGTGSTNISTGELADRIKEGEVTMIVCCSHKKRFKYIIELLINLNKSRLFTKRINIFGDEADAYINLLSSPDLDFTRFEKVDHVYLVSATFNSVVKRYGRIRVMGFYETHPETYMPLQECNIVPFNGMGDVVENLTSVLREHREMCAPGVRLFAPGMIDIASHDAVLDTLVALGFAVMILNGRRKCIVCPDGTTIPLVLRMDPTNPDEISMVLAYVYVQHDLKRWPFAVTGQMCLSRGITFQSAEFMFDYGVLPDLRDPATAYQCLARLLGNIRGFPGFKAPTVFMSDVMKSITIAQEKIAIKIAQMVASEGWCDVGIEEMEFVLDGNRARYEAATRGENTEVMFSPHTFATLEVAREWSKTHLIKSAYPMHLCSADGGDGNTHFHYRHIRLIDTLANTKRSTDLSYAQSGRTGRPRVMPVYVDGRIEWLVVYIPEWKKRTKKIKIRV